MSELSLRRVEYFVVVAAELNFGRAAERLHVTQPVLSRQIALLERELGVPLFERSSRGTSLTEAGRELLPDAQAMLQSAAALQRRGRQVARGTQRLVVGFMPGLLATPILQGLRAAFPALEVSTVRTSWDDQVETILDGRVDLGLVRLPVPDPRADRAAAVRRAPSGGAAAYASVGRPQRARHGRRGRARAAAVAGRRTGVA